MQPVGMKPRRLGLPPSPSQRAAAAAAAAVSAKSAAPSSPSMSSSSMPSPSMPSPSAMAASTTRAAPLSPSPVRASGLRRGAALPSRSPSKAQDPEIAQLQLRRIELKSAIREASDAVRRMQLIDKCLNEEEMNTLMDLCSKWQVVAQQAAEELRGKSGGMITLKQILEAFGIAPESLNYHAASDSFGGTTW